MVAKTISQQNQKCDKAQKIFKEIIICADDFGQNHEISKGIIELIELNRINATSVLTNFKALETDAQILKALNEIFIGLHLNLTEGKPLTFSTNMLSANNQFDTLGELLIKSHLRLLDKKVIYTELKAQLDRFIDTFDKVPDFLDGHQHIHHLPIIREVVLEIYDHYHLKQSNTFIRSIYPLIDPTSLKSFVIKNTGAKKFKKLLTLNNIQHNQTFGGVYDFRANQFKQVFNNALRKISNHGLMMCHPGYQSYEDVLKYSREAELKYFKSDSFSEVMSNNQIILKKKNTV